MQDDGDFPATYGDEGNMGDVTRAAWSLWPARGSVTVVHVARTIVQGIKPCRERVARGLPLKQRAQCLDLSLLSVSGWTVPQE